MTQKLSLPVTEKPVALVTTESLEAASVFTESVQLVCRHLDIPIAIVGTMQADVQYFKASMGLACLGRLNTVLMTKQIPSHESFCLHVMQNSQPLAICDTQTHPLFSQYLLAQKYKIRAYLGVPLLGEAGHCLGTLAVMDLVPRSFDDKAIDVLTLTARWCMSEYARLYQPSPQITETPLPDRPIELVDPAIDQLRQALLGDCIQNLKIPLTTIVGMTGMIKREIYGPLLAKQREYLELVAQAGQDLLYLSDAMLDLSLLRVTPPDLKVTVVDIQALCQQILYDSHQLAQRFDQHLHLGMEPGKQYYSLDKDKVRLMLHYLVVHFLQQSDPGSQINLHISSVENGLHLEVWATPSWVQEGGGEMPPKDKLDVNGEISDSQGTPLSLGLQFSQRLAELHGGQWNLDGITGRGTIFLPAIS